MLKFGSQLSKSGNHLFLKHIHHNLTFSPKLRCTRSATASTVNNVVLVIDTVNATVYLQNAHTLLTLLLTQTTPRDGNVVSFNKCTKCARRDYSMHKFIVFRRITLCNQFQFHALNLILSLLLLAQYQGEE